MQRIQKAYADRTYFLKYEDLCDDLQGEMSGVFKFLKLSDHVLEIKATPLPASLRRKFLEGSLEQEYRQLRSIVAAWDHNSAAELVHAAEFAPTSYAPARKNSYY